MRTNPQIRVMEIDFVQVGDDFVSSHDYGAENIKNGSPLLQWIEYVVIKHKKILWIDVKSHVDFMAFCCCCDMRFKFDCRALFRVLARICKTLQQRLQDRVWLSCQDKEVRQSFITLNNRLDPRYQWIVTTDLPFVYSYAVSACRYLLPMPLYLWLQDRAFLQFLNYDFEATRISEQAPIVVCIDQSFFPSTERLIRFIEDSTIPLGSIIVLYTFENTQTPIIIRGYEIIMQYDYVPQIRKKARPRPQLNKSKSF